MNIRAVVPAIALLLAAVPALAQQSESFVLLPQHGAREHGKATLTQQGSDVVVTIVVRRLAHPAAPQFAHFHRGTCAQLGPPLAYGLNPIRNGRSSTTLKHTSLAALSGAPYAIAIHQTLAHFSMHIACGGPNAGK